MCRDCGHVMSCPACSGPLVVHFDDLDERQKTKDESQNAPTKIQTSDIRYQVSEPHQGSRWAR